MAALAMVPVWMAAKTKASSSYQGWIGQGFPLRPFLTALPAGIKPTMITYPPDQLMSLGQHAELVMGIGRTAKLFCWPSPFPDWWR